MRWIWIDKFELFEPGKRAVAIKNVSLAEDHLHDHFPGFPVMPASLMIEGMAQTSGILVGAARDFKEKVILAKIGRATFSRLVRPGSKSSNLSIHIHRIVTLLPNRRTKKSPGRFARGLLFAFTRQQRRIRLSHLSYRCT